MMRIASTLNDPNRLVTTSATIMAPAAPAIARDQGFFGLTEGNNSGPAKARPAKYPRTSVVQTTANTRTITANPYALSPRINIGASNIAPAYPTPSVTHSCRPDAEKIAVASAPSPTISNATTGLPSHAKKSAPAIAPAHVENTSRYELPATSMNHSQSTASAATPQKSANGQSPRYAVSSASGANTMAERTRRARLLPDTCLPVSPEETGSTPSTSSGSGRATSPPNRRSRCWYSRIADSSTPRSKSGQ